MCGVNAYIGRREAVPIVLEGLKKLEYRGYDSTGIAAICDHKLKVRKKTGKVCQLESVAAENTWASSIAIAHTRWATHGKVSEMNAHPHCDMQSQCAVVHNGIIENHEAIRSLLEKRGVVFRSDTDSEVISQLIGSLYKGDLLKAFQRILPLLQGAFAIALIHQNHPDQIICAARECPLAIGLGEGEKFIASDSQAFIKYTRRVIYLHSSEVALITKDHVKAFDERATPITKEIEDLGHEISEAKKGPFKHYMLKEIYEQPQTLRNVFLSRYCQDYGTAIFDGLCLNDEELLKIQRILILGCGTSFHAGLLGLYIIEEMARIPVEIEISSEFRYKNPIVQENTLAIAISQSGETADTLAAMRELKEKGAKILGICNNQGSTLAREATSCLFLRAGVEIGVASTKAFTSQLAIIVLFALRLARMRGMSQQEGKRFIQSLVELPVLLKKILEQKETVRLMAKKYAHHENFIFLGRRFMYPIALEGALKLKEITYIHADCYAAGEMKHGPIALINKQCPTMAFCADSVTFQKILNNLREVKAREGNILAVVPEGWKDILHITKDVIWVPPTLDELAPILSVVVGQLFAYYVARERGTEIDNPRNLAKTVTVE